MFIINNFIEELEDTMDLLVINDLNSARKSVIAMKERYKDENFNILAEKYSDIIILYYNLCEFLLNTSSNEFDVVSRKKIIDSYNSEEVKNLLVMYSNRKG